MVTPGITLLFLGFLLLVLYGGGVVFYIWYNKQSKKQLALAAEQAREKEEIRQRLQESLRSDLDHIREAIDQFSRHMDFQTGYFSNHHLTVWKDSHARIFNAIKDQRLDELGLDLYELGTVQAFTNDYRNAETLRADFNNRFLDEELEKYREFLDTLIPGKKLDLQQRTAIATDEDNNLVVAGAGTGKTTTILGKVHYVSERYAVPPEEILLISFTNKSASDLSSRIKIGKIEVKTFHKFGMDVIAAVEGYPPSIFDADEHKLRLLLRNFLQECIADLGYLGQVIEFFTEFFKRPRAQFEFKNQGDYIQYLKDQNVRPYQLKAVREKGRTTWKTETVKSIEECRIANFLLFNNLDYTYEQSYEFDVSDADHRQYKPDFTIKQNGRTVYLEHFAVARNGNVPPFFAREGETYSAAKKRYWDKIHWARKTHQTHKTQLIETYSYEMSEGILFQKFAQRLQVAGLILQPKSTAEIWRIILDSGQDDVGSFLTLLGTFITLLKSNNYSIADVRKRNTQIRDLFERTRNDLLLALIEPIYERYQRHLAERREIDFNDMINRAAAYISAGKYNRRYRYIIIDEFQDISIGRYQLVQALKSRNPDCKLFCVGDDWQSIYRFAGSDMALFREFAKFFGFTVKSRIETTYRFHEPLIKLSSDFILKNPNQEIKTLKGAEAGSPSTNYKIVYSISEDQDDTLALKQVFDEMIATTSDLAIKQVILLGRYAFDFDRIKNPQGLFGINKSNSTISYTPASSNASPTIDAQYLTVHSAKGLEADIVIVLNCNAGKYGFPSRVSDDPLLNLLLSKADQFENGEERRLFYVALTRAREQVYLITDEFHKSKFITELEVESNSSTLKKCPRCKTADLVKRNGISNGKPWAFWGCANYAYGCDYQEWIS